MPENLAYFCSRALCSLSIAMLLAAVCGCESAETEQAQAEEDSRLRPIAIMLGKYSRDVGGKPPDEEAFKKYLQSQPQAEELMKKWDASTIDEFLTSERDGKKFVIIYRGMENQVQGDVWAYEAEGVDGKRMVVDSIGYATPMPEEEFRKLVPNP